MPKLMPNAESIVFKEKFVDRYSKLTDFDVFREYSLSFLRKSIRVNTIKSSVKEITEKLTPKWELTKIPWCKEGFWLESDRLDIGNLREHVLGYIYVQEAASMIPPVVLNPKKDELILDMCAAPGSKSTQIAAMMKNTGLLVSNDLEYSRLKALTINMQRCGVSNAIITLMEGHWFKDIEFDRVLVDAPCSATGTIRKSIKTINMWNPNAIKNLSGLQKKLLTAGFNVLKGGGTLVYSTCTLEPEEDEGVVSCLLENFENAKLQKINIDLKRSNAVEEFEGKQYNSEVKKCLRIWPQDNDTEGFFVAKIKKG